MSLQIRSIILYNSSGATRQLNLQPGGVNVIAGGSNTGKSAIIPIIEYCLGVSEFNVPGDVIRRTVACYAVLYSIAETNILIAKRPPSDNGTRQYLAHYQVNPAILPPPLESLIPNTNDDEVGLRLGRLLSAVSKDTQQSVVISHLTSLTNTHYYLFQKSTVIANDSILFHRQETKSQEIRATLPYFLGIVQEADLELDKRLEDARKQFQRMRARVNDERRRQRDLIVRGQGLAAEAQELGLIVPTENLSTIEDMDSLKGILDTVTKNWHPAVTPVAVEDPRLPTLRQELDQLKQDYSRIRVMLESARALQREIAGYTDQIEEQRLRLRSVNIFSPQDPFEFAETSNLCPLCQSPLTDDHLHIPQISAIRRALNKIENDLFAVQMEQPLLTAQVGNIENQFSQKQREIDRKQLEIAAILDETRTAENIVQEITQNNSRIDRLVGRIEFYLEIVTTNSLDELIRQRHEAEQEFRSLEHLKVGHDFENNKRRVLNLLSEQMTVWAESLGISRRGRYLLDIDRLTVLIDDENRTYTMTDIGGGANYLKCHLVTLLALHKHFIAYTQPVPGFIILDQPAQVFFPSRADYEALQSPSPEPGRFLPGEIAAAQTMFDFLFRVSDDLNGNLQIIILEHAYFEQPQFERALVNGETWFEGTGLIPKEWIENILPSHEQARLL